MKKYKVDSLSKYLALIEENIISDFIYRGQSEPYFSIQASGFRPYCGGWDSDMIYDMPYLHTSFYNRVIGQLSEDERKYFLAFCQHHGIPTNLVDVSYSPLVALFFACDGKSERKFTLSEFIGDLFMRLANGIVIDKEATFGALKFSALRREVRIQNEDGTVSDEIKERTYDLKSRGQGRMIQVSIPASVPLKEFDYNAEVEIINPVADTVATATFQGAEVDWYIKADDIVLKGKPAQPVENPQNQQHMKKG